MIVVDASAVVEALIGRDTPGELLDLVAREPLAAPHLLDVEVLSTLRGLTRGHRLDDELADAARRTYFALTITRYETAPLAERIWELRHRCTAYDSTYLALAEALDADLVTADAKLLAGGSAARIRIIPSSG
ncbi:type II toxin-antitoxin system VapC family toxin [Brachybacterium sp. AOP3-A1-3]|uniref:type II toxin-antitoxin system VapC family toxin n=1 Tax=Brachybacterium sp. AOP3-A1-3 TaxID=3457699 RepID=UPI004034D238